MDTREKLELYLTMQREEAERFLTENISDERFVALVMLRRQVVKEVLGYLEAYEKIVGPTLDLRNPESEPVIQGLVDLVRGLKVQTHHE